MIHVGTYDSFFKLCTEHLPHKRNMDQHHGETRRSGTRRTGKKKKKKKKKQQAPSLLAARVHV